MLNDKYPIHMIKDQLEAMSSSTVLKRRIWLKSTIKSLLYDDSKLATALSTPEGFNQWKVLPLEINTASNVFQRVIDQVKQ